VKPFYLGSGPLFEEWPRSNMRKSWLEAQAYMLCLGAIAA
jgi:hypothetical protein